MISINSYIVEKLKINKDTTTVKTAFNKYKAGDWGLLIWFNKHINTHECTIIINFIEITKVEDKTPETFNIYFKNLNVDGKSETANRRWFDIKKNENYAIDIDTSGKGFDYYTFGIILPENKCIEFLNTIKKDKDLSIDLCKFVDEYPDFIKPGERKQIVNYSPSRSNAYKLDKDTINKMIQLLDKKGKE